MLDFDNFVVLHSAALLRNGNTKHTIPQPSLSSILLYLDGKLERPCERAGLPLLDHHHDVLLSQFSRLYLRLNKQGRGISPLLSD